MIKGVITLRPVGGLCNRLFAIDSMLRICEKISYDLEIIWLKNEDLGAFFTDLYQPLKHHQVNIEWHQFHRRPFLYSDRLLNHPRQKIFNTLLKFYQRSRYQHVLHASETAHLKADGYDFHQLATYKTTYLSSWGRMDQGRFEKGYFKPMDSIQHLIPTFKSPTVGVHVRRTDHARVISSTPVEKFFRTMDEELKKAPKLNFFVASDSEEVKRNMKERYGDLIKTQTDEAASRGTAKGMSAAMVDLYGLANTQKIIGTSVSTFTQMASEINNIELIEIGQ